MSIVHLSFDFFLEQFNYLSNEALVQINFLCIDVLLNLCQLGKMILSPPGNVIFFLKLDNYVP